MFRMQITSISDHWQHSLRLREFLVEGNEETSVQTLVTVVCWVNYVKSRGSGTGEDGQMSTQ